MNKNNFQGKIGFKNPTAGIRMAPHNYLPDSVTRRSISNVDAVEEIVTSSVTMGNGDQAIHQGLVSAKSRNRIIASVERATYIGSKSNSNLLPGGSAIDESQWQVIGPFNSIIKSTTGLEAEQYENSNWLYVRNISAGTVTVIFENRVKFVINGGGIS